MTVVGPASRLAGTTVGAVRYGVSSTSVVHEHDIATVPAGQQAAQQRRTMAGSATRLRAVLMHARLIGPKLLPSHIGFVVVPYDKPVFGFAPANGVRRRPLPYCWGRQLPGPLIHERIGVTGIG
jgi:hypothetical protein